MPSNVEYAKQELKFAANPGNNLAVSTEFPASVNADSVPTISRAMKLGPCHFEYTAPAWSGVISSKQCNDLEEVQKRACIVIIGNDYVRYSDALQLCNIETLYCHLNQPLVSIFCQNSPIIHGIKYVLEFKLV